MEVGDIVRLKKGDMCPADIILLDSNDIHNKEAVCYVDTSLVDGKTSLQMKSACAVTQSNDTFAVFSMKFVQFLRLVLTRTHRKQHFTEYRKMLTGTVEYNAPAVDLSTFTGLIKLKKDPKKGVLSIKNLILRYSMIKHTGW